MDWRDKPAGIRVENGTKFTSAGFTGWCKKEDIQLQYTQPGKLRQNGFIERFNSSYRHEILDAYLFFDLEEVRELTIQRMEEYNTK